MGIYTRRKGIASTFLSLENTFVIFPLTFFPPSLYFLSYKAYPSLPSIRG